MADPSATNWQAFVLDGNLFARRLGESETLDITTVDGGTVRVKAQEWLVASLDGAFMKMSQDQFDAITESSLPPLP